MKKAFDTGLIDQSWAPCLFPEFKKPYFKKLESFVAQRRKTNEVYPPANLVFNAFNKTSLDVLKVVLLGQDPYHGPNQAHGLAFSVPRGVKKPPSLRNIFKELHDDIGMEEPLYGDLTRWAMQGVLLLNAILTVDAGKMLSHQDKGWELCTDTVIHYISAAKHGIVFLLWGVFAQKKEALIDTDRHFVLKAAHPSPLSAHRGFFGCSHFSRTNTLLRQQGKHAIDWNP